MRIAVVAAGDFSLTTTTAGVNAAPAGQRTHLAATPPPRAGGVPSGQC